MMSERNRHSSELCDLRYARSARAQRRRLPRFWRY
jgi:hypothetical protein